LSEIDSMPILSILDQSIEFEAFWCDARDPAARDAMDQEPSTVVLVFAPPLPRHWGLLVVGHHGGSQHGLHLCERANRAASTRRITGVPIPWDWETFTLVLTPYSAVAPGPAVELAFARRPPQGVVATASGRLLHLVDARPWIEARLHSGNRFFSSWLRLYQYTADGTILPAVRSPSSGTAAYRLEVHAPKPRNVPADHSLKITFHAGRDEEAIRAIKNTLLWHISPRLRPDDRTTLGTFPAAEDRFTSVAGVPKSDVIEFAIPAAMPGDVFCLAPSLEDVAVNFGTEIEPVIAQLDKGLLVFELDRNGRPVQLVAPTLARPSADSLLNLGTHEAGRRALLHKQVTDIRMRFARGKNEIGDLADFMTRHMGSHHVAGLSAMEKAAYSMTQFAIGASLLDELLRNTQIDPADLMAIVRPGDGRLIERVCSAATWRAAGDQTSRRALRELAGGVYSGWRAPDGLRAVFATAFEVLAPSGNDKQAAQRWYSNFTADDPAARAALLALERQSPEQAWTVVRAGLRIGLGDLAKNDLAAIASFCETRLLDPARDLALTDATRFVCGALEQNPELRSIAAELQSRLAKSRTLEAIAEETPLAADDIRRFRSETEDAIMATKPDQIRAAFEIDNQVGDIPRFERERPPFTGPLGAGDLIEMLKAMKDLPDHWSRLTAEAIAAPWPLGALAALVATLTRARPEEPSLYEKDSREDRREVDRLLNIARGVDPQLDEDVRATSFLFASGASANSFVELVRDRARRFVEHNEKLLSGYSGLPSANISKAAQKRAADRLIDIVRDTIDRHLQLMQKFSERVNEAMAGATQATNDSTQLKQLGKVAEENEKLTKRYEEVDTTLRSRQDSGRAVLKPEALEEIGNTLKQTRTELYELSRLWARVCEIRGGA
jgi:hypothetical protein